MKHNIEIIVKINDVNFNLETFDVEAMPITYQISDISDFKNNKSTFSKTITLPLTDNNKKVLGFITNLYNTANLFSPVRKTEVYITRDNILIFQGVMEYNEVDITEDSFSIVVYEDNYQLWSLIGDKYLTDLDYSRYDHTISSLDVAAMTQSWYSDYNNGYYYGLIDWSYTTSINTTNPIYTPIDFKPLWYLKPIVYQIFAENGYAINSTFFDSDYFENLLVGDGTISKYLSAMSVELPVGATAGSTILPGQFLGYTQNPLLVPFPIAQRYYVGNFNADTIIVDALGEYNTSTYIYTAADPATKTFNISYNFNYGDNIEKYFLTGDPDQPFPENVLYAFEIGIICRKISPSGYVTYGGAPGANVLTTGTKTLISSGSSITVDYEEYWENWNIQGSVLFDFDSTIEVGDTIQFEFRISYATQNNCWGPNDLTDTDWLPYWDANAYITATGPCIIQKVYGDSSIGPYGNINASKSLPRNIKQTDFLNSVFKTFNLYIEPSKQYNKTFNIEPRDVYYSQVQKVSDWSDKVDLSQSIISSVLSNEQKRINTFTYKEDKDYDNTTYTNQTQRTYGDYIYKLDNYYLEGENKIELIFSPSVMVEFPPTSTTGTLFAPQIIQIGIDSNGVTNASPYSGCNIRLLTRNKVNPTSNFTFGGLTSSAITYTFYPYVGHTDNPLSPNYDILFSPVNEFYISSYTITPNNLYNTFWNNTMDALSNPQAKLLSLYVYLTPTDIKQFRFNDLIYIEGLGGSTNYWRVNKINNYDPITNLPTLVELIEAFDYTLPGVQSISIDNITSGSGTGVNPGYTNGLPPNTNLVKNIQDYTNVNGNKIAVTGLVNGRNNNLSPGSKIGTPFITGNDNSVISSTSITMGDNNSVVGENIYLLGSNNQIGGASYSMSNIFNIGSNNKITSDASNIVMIGNNITATQSGITYIGNNVVFTAGFPAINTTWTNLTTVLIPGNLLSVGSLYKIDTEGSGIGYDNGVYLMAISTNQLNKTGVRIVYSPSEYAPGIIDGSGNYWLGVWNASLASVAIGRLTIWGGRVWSNTTGLVGSASDDFNLDANWSVIDKNSFTNNEYIQLQTSVVYDYVNNWVERQEYNNNVVGVIWGALSYQPCDATDWNIATLYNNISPSGIFNNTYQNINNNRVTLIKNNVDVVGSSAINDNICVGYYISDNSCANISYNINNGIVGNTNNNDIIENFNNGAIFNNSTIGTITQNSNNGDISNNDNFVVNITQNLNNGDIGSNTGSSSTYNIYSNINNGSISGSHTADVTDPIVNK